MTDRAARRELLALAVRCLRFFAGFPVKRADVGDSTVMVQRTTCGIYDCWFITDNGGEFNVERVNEWEKMRSVPYTEWGALLDPATMAYRVACVMTQTPIDYGVRFTDDDLAVLLAA